MIGTIANASTILVGSIIGSTLRKGFDEKYKNIMMDSMGLAATALGINSVVQAMPDSKYHVLFIVSLALGGIIGILIGYGLSAAATRVVTSLMEATLTVSPSAGAVALAFGISVGIGILFGYLPAKKAAALNPIDALHYD